MLPKIYLINLFYFDYFNVLLNGQTVVFLQGLFINYTSDLKGGAPGGGQGLSFVFPQGIKISAKKHTSNTEGSGLKTANYF